MINNIPVDRLNLSTNQQQNRIIENKIGNQIVSVAQQDNKYSYQLGNNSSIDDLTITITDIEFHSEDIEKTNTKDKEKLFLNQVSQEILKKKNADDFLSEQQIVILEHYLLEFKTNLKSRLQYPYYEEIFFELLKKLPIDISEKLTVVTESHNGNSLIKYYGYGSMANIFIIGKNLDGQLKIFDPMMFRVVSRGSKDWIKSAFNREDIQFSLISTNTQKSMPQFRFFNACQYINDHYDAACMDTIYTGDMLINSREDEYQRLLKLDFWKKSFSINLYECIIFFTDPDENSQAIRNHRFDVNPMDRLTNNQVKFILDFL